MTWVKQCLRNNQHPNETNISTYVQKESAWIRRAVSLRLCKSPITLARKRAQRRPAVWKRPGAVQGQPDGRMFSARPIGWFFVGPDIIRPRHMHAAAARQSMHRALPAVLNIAQPVGDSLKFLLTAQVSVDSSRHRAVFAQLKSVSQVRTVTGTVHPVFDQCWTV